MIMKFYDIVEIDGIETQRSMVKIDIIGNK